MPNVTFSCLPSQLLRPRFRLIVLRLLSFLFIVSVTPYANRSANTAPRIQFVDITEQAQIRFRHDNAATPRKYIIETMGSGGAWIDYDMDGFLDLFFVNGGPTPAYKVTSPPKHALYRNLGDGTFQTVTKKARVAGDGSFGMGAAVADFDNDGYPDIYLTGYPHSILYRNQRDGTFRDIATPAGIRNEKGFGSSAGWFDYNKDGWLDLLVLNYLDWSYETDVYCGDKDRGMRQYCHPDNYRGASPVLYRNNGDGTFADVSEKSGVENPDGKGLGLILADFNNDAWTDIFIANDGVRNFLYFNLKDGTFEDVTYSSGVGYSEDGFSEAGMGTDAADFMHQGWLGIYVTHLEFQRNRLYKYIGEGVFVDYTAEAGLARGRNLLSGFGTRFMDFDNDGLADIFVTNGHILDNIHLVHSDVEYAEPKFMLRNVGGGRFENVSSSLGPAFQTKHVGRGAMVGDFDNDGDLDIATTNNGEPPELLRNDGGNANNWIALYLIGTKGCRDPVGARVTVRACNLRQMDEIKGGTSYLSTGDARLYFGLSTCATVDEIKIRWPGGKEERFESIPARQILTIKEGAGIQADGFPRFQTP